MNDFTKEELQYFLDRIDTACKHERELYKKVKFMIDNYCDHEHLKDVGASYKVCRGCAEEVYTDE